MTGIIDEIVFYGKTGNVVNSDRSIRGSLLSAFDRYRVNDSSSRVDCFCINFLIILRINARSCSYLYQRVFA